MENLIGVLNEECDAYEELLKASMKKTPAIVSDDLETLSNVTEEEQEIVGRISSIDHKRSEAWADIANVLNRDVKTLKLKDLIKIMENRPEEQKALSKIYDRLHSVTKEVSRVNKQNQELLESALEMVQYTMNVIQSSKAAPENANYNGMAENTGATLGSARSSFDAKQ
ncbi:MAG: flagellar protein FlgN [Lachnospiraceae bacterium]|nr:flagellar protein FlgN [Lachnospiraceae bacterium]